MPQPLVQPQPTSSVAAMLDRGVGASIVTKVQTVPAATPSTAGRPDMPSNLESCTIPRQFLLSPATDNILNRLQEVLAATGLQLRHSEILRAALVAFDRIMPGIEREAAVVGRLRRPKNGKGSKFAQEEIELRIALVFLAAHDRTRP